MNKKYISISILLIALVLIGAECGVGVPGCDEILEKAEDTAEKVKDKVTGLEKYYEEICEVSVPFQKKAMEYYGMELTQEQYSEFGYHINVEECVEKSIEGEKQLFDMCMEEKDDKKECEEFVEEWREAAGKMATREGCENLYIGFQCFYYNPGEEVMQQATPEERAYMEQMYQECIAEIKELCKELPEEL